MSEETRPSVAAAVTPSNRYQKLLEALKEECDPSLASDKEEWQTLEINHNGKSLSAPIQSSPNLSTECSPIPELSMEKSCSFSSTSGGERQDCAPAVYEIVWDHSMSDDSEEEETEEETEEEEDFPIFDGEVYDKWYSGASVADACHDNWQTDQAYCELVRHYEEDENSYEGDEVAIKLEELAHSDKSSYVPGKILYKWSHDIEEDEDRNKIYDKWICDLENWERQRLLWLDARGKIDGFDSSGDKDRTFLVKVDTADSEKPESQAGPLKRDEQWFASSLPSLNEDHFCDQSKEDDLGMNERLDYDNPKTKREVLNKDSSTSLMRYSKDPMESVGASECEPLTLPHNLTSVFEFTNRYLWRKYHNCFKEGKYHNNQ